MRSIKKLFVIALCLMLTMATTGMLTGCGSEAKKAMASAVESANALISKGETPYDATTKDKLKKAIESADKAKDNESYQKVTKDIGTATKAYKKSIKQLKQVTNPKESFLIERAKTVDTVTEVEAATEKTDPNEMLKKSGSYTSYIAMKSSLVDDKEYKDESPVEAGTDGGAVIEAFKTVKDAKARQEYLAAFDQGALSTGTHKIIGTLLIRTSNELTASQQKRLEKNIINALIKLGN